MQNIQTYALATLLIATQATALPTQSQNTQAITPTHTQAPLQLAETVRHAKSRIERRRRGAGTTVKK